MAFLPKIPLTVLRLAKRWGVLVGGGIVLALAGCMSAFPEKPVTYAEPGPLAKRLAGNYTVTIAGEESASGRLQLRHKQHRRTDVEWLA